VGNRRLLTRRVGDKNTQLHTPKHAKNNLQYLEGPLRTPLSDLTIARAFRASLAPLWHENCDLRSLNNRMYATY
jgi:hypothetical protein